MPVYTYRARDRAGKVVTSTMDAASQRDVATALRAKGMFVAEIKEPKSGLSMDIKMPAWLDKPGFRDITIFSRQFATVINAGLPVVQSLAILQKQADKQGMKDALGKIRNDVET
ncbi:MAG: type II secretion system F family protein, partial [Trueperaceae bacterium]|nr:type II secretion system F family protein [Trueperaceae bacterium]